MNKLDVKKLNPLAILPTRSNEFDAGLDLYALEEVVIPKGETRKIKTGIAAHILPGFVGLIRDRSSMASKGLIIGAGVVDADYSGDLTIVMHNFSGNAEYVVQRGGKIAQLLIQEIKTPYVNEVTFLWDVVGRGSNGFGSSGQ